MYWLVFDVDGTRSAARQRSLPKTADLPAAARRMDKVCAPGYSGRKRGEVVRAYLKATESQYFGSTEAGSPLRVRVVHHLEPTQDKSKYVLPSTVGDRRPYKHAGFHESTAENAQRIRLVLDTHPLYQPKDVFKPPLFAALLLAFHLGAFGKRARRGGGVLQVVKVEADWEDTELQQFKALVCFQPETSAKLLTFFNSELVPFTDTAQQSIKYTPSRQYVGSHLPEYPIWMQEHVKVLVKGQGYNDNPNEQPDKPQPEFHEGYRRALQDLWSLSGNLHHIDNAWGYAKGNRRRASALHIRVQKSTGSAYYPLVTMFRSGNTNEQWDRLETFDQILRQNNYSCLGFCQGVWS